MYRESYFCTKMNRVAWGWGGDSAIDKGTIFGGGEGRAIVNLPRELFLDKMNRVAALFMERGGGGGGSSVFVGTQLLFWD